MNKLWQWQTLAVLALGAILLAPSGAAAAEQLYEDEALILAKQLRTDLAKLRKEIKKRQRQTPIVQPEAQKDSIQRVKQLEIAAKEIARGIRQGEPVAADVDRLEQELAEYVLGLESYDFGKELEGGWADIQKSLADLKQAIGSGS